MFVSSVSSDILRADCSSELILECRTNFYMELLHVEQFVGVCTSIYKQILQLFVLLSFIQLQCLHYTSLRGKGREFFCILTVWKIFYSCFDGYVCYLYCNLDSIDIWQRTQFSRKQKSLTDGKQKGAILEKSCQRRSMNLKFTDETRLLPWAEVPHSASSAIDFSVPLHRCEKLLFGPD